MRIFSDDTLITRPITAGRAYAWAALSANWTTTLLIALSLAILSVLSAIPLLGLFASVVQGIFLYAPAYRIVALMRQNGTPETFKNAMAAENVQSVLTKHFGPSAGYYLGFMVMTLAVFVITGLIFWLGGGSETLMVSVTHMQGDTPTPEQIDALYGQAAGGGSAAFLFLILVSLFFSYVWPLVYGYALTQERFGEAFKASFMLLSPRFWRASFNGAYFRHVSLWMLIMLAAAIVLGICMATVILIPVGLLLLLWMIYFTAIAAAEAYNFFEDL